MSTETELPLRLDASRVHSRLPLRIVERPAPPPPPPKVDISALSDAVHREAEALDQQLRAALGDWEEACVALCKSAVERILGRELRQAPAELQQALRELSTEHRHRLEGATVQVRVHPDCAEALQLALQEQDSTPFQLHADPELEPGELRLHTEHTRIVRRLGDEMRRTFAAWDGREPGS